jgi:cobalt-zinc-cadmium efflux system protein
MGAGHKHHHADHTHHEALVAGKQAAARKALWIAFGITFSFFFVEAAAGFITGSLALLADAGHMLTDVSSLAMALVANWFSSRAATHKRSYGWQRLEIMAAFMNGLALLMISLYIASEAWQRFSAPPPVQGGVMLVVAAGGLLCNVVSAFVLFRASEGNLNVKAAFFHVLADMFGSVGALVAGFAVLTFGWMIADPIIAVFISLLVLASSWGLIKESGSILLQSTPGHIDPKLLEQDILAVAGVQQVHDLHVWTMTSGYLVLTVHVVVENDADGDDVLHRVNEMFEHNWGIHHTTVQLEWTSREHKEVRRH